MNCPECGTQNADTNRFCLKCGHKLIDGPVPERPPQPPPPYPFPPKKSQDPVSQLALIGGIIGIVGGGLTVLGWLIPWFSLGGLANTALNYLGIGSRSGFLNFGLGVGSGLQMSLILLVGSFAAFTSEDVAIFGLLGLIMFGILISIPLLGVQNVRAGINAIELRMTQNKGPISGTTLNEYFKSMRNRSKTIFVIMLIIFITMAVIPFGTAVLGSGFYLTVLGAICSYLGAFFNQSKLLSIPTPNTESHL